MGIIELVQFRILTVNCQCILGQIICSDAEEIHFPGKLPADHNGSRCFDHDSDRGCAEGNAPFGQFSLHLVFQFSDATDLVYSGDHRVHDGDIAVGGGTIQCSQLRFEELRSGQADSDRPQAQRRIFFRFQFEIITLLVCTDVQGSDDHRFSGHGFRNSFVDRKLFLFGGILFSLQIEEFTSEKTDSLGIVFQYQ